MTDTVLWQGVPVDRDVAADLDRSYRECHRDVDAHSKLAVPFDQLPEATRELWRRHARHLQHLPGCDCEDER